ncbi:MAG: aspartate kinase [Acidobacteria bacterium]|nr:MAG: aspartate kinase [Acidobacteriota bacterium]
MRVMKFGGTSVGDATRIRGAAKIVADAARHGGVVAVVSAMSGVTNRLVEAALASAEGCGRAGVELRESLRAQHAAAIEALISDEAERARLTADVEQIAGDAATLCRGTAMLRELTPRALDAISSVGERLSARLMAGALKELGLRSVAVEATEVIVTDDEHGQAEPLMDETRERATKRLLPLLAEGVVPVVTGFIGASRGGTLTTLGRGGSDYSATILGAALEAAEIIIWTDVDGVLTADPRLVSDARTINDISYAEAAELAYFGAKVLHPKTLRPVADAAIPVWIRNSFEPEKGGTKITPAGHPSLSGVKAITAISDVSLITVGGRGIVDVPGVAAKTFTAAASVRANVLMISQASSQNDICFIVNAGDAARTVEALRRAFASDLAHHQVEHINVDSGVAVVAAVGERMRGTPGIAGRLFSALGRRGVNIVAIAQGSSEYNVSFVVAAGAMRDAVTAIHHEFNLHRRDSRFDAETRSLVEV